jgi:hypothetical protein
LKQAQVDREGRPRGRHHPESIGGDIFEQSFECLATFGRYIIFGSTRGPALLSLRGV